MNSLSLLIYLISVFSSLKFTAIIFFFIFLIAIVLFWIGWAETENNESLFSSLIKKSIIGILTCGAIMVIVPNERTMYMIAASEVGQRIVEHPGSQEIIGEVHGIILEKLREFRETKVDERFK